VATITNYGTLKDAIAVYIRRDDLADEMPLYVQLAALRLFNDIKTQWLEKRTAATPTVAGTAEYSLPADFSEVSRLYLQIGQQSIDLDYVESASLQSFAGRPNSYTIESGKLILSPNPDAAYNFILLYKAAPAALINDADTNVLITNAPHALLNGCIFEAMKATQDLQLATVANQEYLQAKERINMQQWNLPTPFVQKPSTRVV
jgi:hypothetical protein